MAKMELTRDQIKKFVDIYEHFHEIKCFTVEHTDDGEFLITFNLNDVELRGIALTIKGLPVMS